MVAAVAFSGVLAGLAEDADDEDKEFYYTLAYLSRRFYSELHFYSSPTEPFKILSTPAASMSMIAKTGQFLDQIITDPFEEYVKGDRKGTSKLLRKGKKLLPVMNQADRSMEDAYKWLASN